MAVVAMKISQDAFNNMPFDSGMWLSYFDVNNPTTPSDNAIICTTTGDININVTAETADLAEDVNNLHGKFKEYQVHKGYTVEASFTALEMSTKVLAMGFGAADVSGNQVKPRNEFKLTDFKDRYWVGKTLGGGLVVAHLMNTISTGGIQFTTTKDGKGTMGITLTAFASVENQDVVPIEFFVIEAENPSLTLDNYSITLHADDYPFTLVATAIPEGTSITWASGDTDTATVESTWNGCKITPVAAGRTAVTGTMTVSGVDYTATCLVTVDAGA